MLTQHGNLLPALERYSACTVGESWDRLDRDGKVRVLATLIRDVSALAPELGTTLARLTELASGHTRLPESAP